MSPLYSKGETAVKLKPTGAFVGMANKSIPFCAGTFLDSEQREDLCLSISLSGIREEELVLNVSEEDLLEAYFSDPQQNYGSPPQQSGNEHSEAT